MVATDSAAALAEWETDMGLLGDSWDDPKTQAALNLAAGLLSGGNFGQALGRGLAGYSDTLQNSERMGLLKQQTEAQATENELRKAQVAKALKDQARQTQIEELAQQFYRPGASAASNALGVAAGVGQAGPTMLAQALLPAAQATPASFDMNGYMNALMKIDPLAAIKMQQDAQKANEIQLKPGEQIFDRATGKVKFGTPETPNLTFVPGNGYRPDVMVDSKRGFVPIQGAGAPQAQQLGAAGGGFLAAPSPAATQTAAGQRAPWAGMPPEQADKFKQSVYESEAKKLQDLRDSVSKGQKTLTALEKFGEVNRQTGTGGLADRFLPDILTTDENKQLMLSIQDALAPSLRAPGSGGSSDTDVRLMKSGVPGIDKTGPVNRQIRDRYASMLKADQEELAFKERYLTQNGHLNGADEAYQAFKGQPNQPASSQPAKPVTVTPNGKLLSGEKRAALDAIIKSGNPVYLEQARAKGWIQ